MTAGLITLSQHERDAINLLIEAIEVQPEKESGELKTSVRILRQYLDSPSHRLFSLAKIAFDDKGDLRGGAVTMYQVRQGKWQAVETIGGDSARSK